MIKYPKDERHYQQSIKVYTHWNANEFRTLVNYALIYIMRDHFQDISYYHNLIKFVLCLRLLKQEFVLTTRYKA